MGTVREWNILSENISKGENVKYTVQPKVIPQNLQKISEAELKKDWCSFPKTVEGILEYSRKLKAQASNAQFKLLNPFWVQESSDDGPSSTHRRLGWKPSHDIPRRREGFHHLF